MKQTKDVILKGVKNPSEKEKKSTNSKASNSKKETNPSKKESKKEEISSDKKSTPTKPEPISEEPTSEKLKQNIEVPKKEKSKKETKPKPVSEPITPIIYKFSSDTITGEFIRDSKNIKMALVKLESGDFIEKKVKNQKEMRTYLLEEFKMEESLIQTIEHELFPSQESKKDVVQPEISIDSPKPVPEIKIEPNIEPPVEPKPKEKGSDISEIWCVFNRSEETISAFVSQELEKYGYIKRLDDIVQALYITSQDKIIFFNSDNNGKHEINASTNMATLAEYFKNKKQFKKSSYETFKSELLKQKTEGKYIFDDNTFVVWYPLIVKSQSENKIETKLEPKKAEVKKLDFPHKTTGPSTMIAINEYPVHIYKDTIEITNKSVIYYISCEKDILALDGYDAEKGEVLSDLGFTIHPAEMVQILEKNGKFKLDPHGRLYFMALFENLLPARTTTKLSNYPKVLPRKDKFIVESMPMLFVSSPPTTRTDNNDLAGVFPDETKAQKIAEIWQRTNEIVVVDGFEIMKNFKTEEQILPYVSVCIPIVKGGNVHIGFTSTNKHFWLWREGLESSELRTSSADVIRDVIKFFELFSQNLSMKASLVLGKMLKELSEY